MNYFDGKMIYLTGASSGIGLEMGKILAAQGADLLLLARNRKKLMEAKSEMDRLTCRETQKINIMSVDVGNHRNVQKKMNIAVQDFGPPHILINSAGVNLHADRFENISHDMFDEVMKINLYGVRNMIHSLLDSLKETKGQVVVLSSAAALFGMFGYTSYGTSKAALMGFAESLRYEMKPLGISLSVMYPPEVDTPMNLEEAKTLPAEGRAQKTMGGFLMPDYTARVILKAVARKQFMYVPGHVTRFFYFLHRLSNGWTTRITSDAVIAKARKNIR
ncbi:MAG: short-chain dehydrogenase [Spirochaetae bacterium HGW-Spirochaetae-1]|jgi:3-dehydrosphinganine reductase|nr:MAG: short-chain dehydrogenase [Spirochaetae bacterium HGW-Spirochaetae-1]